MSCRMNPAGSLATTFITRAYGIEDGQDTSLFHAALRASRAKVDAEGPYDAAALRHEYDRVLSLMESQIRTSGRWETPGLRDRALLRVERARAMDITSRLHEAAALCRIRHLAQDARSQMQHLFGIVANGHEGMTRNQVEAEFHRLYRLNPVLTRGDDVLGGYDYLIGSATRFYDCIPGDERTKKALRIILHGERCTACGQFMSPSSTASHTCPGPARRPARRTSPQPSSAPAPAAQPDEMPEPEAPATDPPAPEPWDPEAFQSVYDTVKARIESGNSRIPTDPELEKVPGGVTGGLGLREGGLSFGIEIEVDFPNEEYPFEKRYLLAQRLYQEGLAASPNVERWHFVGGVDRPGGDYVQSPGDWVCEFDRSVDAYDGERGLEIKSQILFDEPRTWQNLRRICEIAEELGAQATPSTGLHVNVGGGDFPPNDTARHNALLRLAGSYDDTIIRLAHNPESGPRHRGRAYCRFVSTPIAGFGDVAMARAYSGHYQAFNLGHLPALGESMQPSSRIEHRVWDSTLDPGRIQAAVTVSLAVVRNAIDLVPPGQEAEPAGSHRSRYARRRLSGEEWESSTESFRRLVAQVGRAGANSDHHREALTTMFAASRWQDQ